MKDDSIFTRHLHDAGETYFQHLAYTIWASLRMIGGGLAVLIHGLCPFVFTSTGSDTIKKLHDEMQTRRAVIKKNSTQG